MCAHMHSQICIIVLKGTINHYTIAFINSINQPFYIDSDFSITKPTNHNFKTHQHSKAVMERNQKLLLVI